MLQNYSDNDKTEADAQRLAKTAHQKCLALFILPLWVFAGFVIAELIVVYGTTLLNYLGVPFGLINDAILSTVSSAVVYLIAIVITIGLPWLIRKYKTDREVLGLTRLPSWMDILITPAGLVIYIVLSAILSYVLVTFFPGLDLNQAQNVGFGEMSQNYEYILAFITLVVVAPLSEELLFRGYLFGKLKKYIPIWLAIVITSVLFGAIHGQWDLAIDTFALSVIMCLLRQITGGLWAPILLHMAKNGIAYYILFINPIFLTTLGS